MDKVVMSTIANALFEIRERKSALNEQIKELNLLEEEHEKQLIEIMEEQGVEKVSTAAGSLTISTKLYPSVQDKDAFVRWAVDNNKIDIIISRANEAVFREYYNEFNEYPAGLDAYSKTKLNIRRSR